MSESRNIEEFERQHVGAALARASRAVVILPARLGENGEAQFPASAQSILKEFATEGVPAELSDPKAGERVWEERGARWVGPTLFISWALVSQNPHVVDLAVNMVAAYLYDLFKGREKESKARLRIICQRKDGSLDALDYDGPVEGIREIGAGVEQLLGRKGDQDGAGKP